MAGSYGSVNFGSLAGNYGSTIGNDRRRQAGAGDVRLVEPPLKGKQSATQIVIDQGIGLALHGFACFMTFIAIVFLFTYCQGGFPPALPWLGTIFTGCSLLIGSMPPVSLVSGSANRSQWMAPIMSFLMIVAAVVCGRFNASIIEPWMYAEHLHHYKDVLADSNPLLYSDGGIVEFASGVQVDLNSSAGFLYWPTTYCAAPIVAAGESGNTTAANATSSAIGFWAVGINCCESRGSFTCNSAQDSNVSGGLRVSSHPFPSSLWSSWTSESLGLNSNTGFERAARMAAAAYGLTVTPDAVYIAWHEDPQGVANQAWYHAFVMAMIFAAGACVVCALLVMLSASLVQRSNPVVNAVRQ
jgi:hypothetical protein